MKMLNLGCGSTFHPDWTNIDMTSISPHVIAHDLRKGIPFPDNYFDVVYHSHILEHMTLSQGKKFMQEALRVLKPEGKLRVVVPDLERIAQTYLEKLRDALNNVPLAEQDYDWMMLELYDQTVRSTSGGEMAAYLAQATIPNWNFIRARIGLEAEAMRSLLNLPRRNLFQRIKSHAALALLRQCRLRLARLAVRLIAGGDAAAAFKEGVFRYSGEIHKWMYDRFSLKRSLTQLGVENIKVCTAHESSIPDFARYALDVAQGEIRKPDSLYIEGIKGKK